MSDVPSFTKLVPGFEFLQTLVKSAGAAMPGIGQWVAPTVDPDEIAKRIEELRTVQFWLEQNVRMLGATIQALEVQRMTLSTLKTMNVQMDGLRESMQIRMPTFGGATADAAPTEAPRWPAAPAEAPPPATESPPAAPGPAVPGVVDPMQWWGALTQQFAQLASGALRDGTAGTPPGPGDAAAAAAMGAAGPDDGVGAPLQKMPRAAPAKRPTAAPAKRASTGKAAPRR
jgi:hypothetical protein